ncbi:dipeptidyl peptidase IV N-terminal region-domain-containing protein [Halteromyces radiatus]|uniref:dipeptidyl peptidase IV N-terminal region-domain-containing protein n=1 Tax=Halteromyces radiatus TaxID=101107 RepID=UPI002220BF33|nr:dipeptidyl peptidase IV N-terminal region-domain-containing protein [Halteromyces radiatus]KAI8084550.1 dipeptidyl peptidase IV N-terminal region-domain-containing protein [Halteromyces radiatus]
MTSSIPLQHVTHSPTMDTFVDQFMTMVDSRHSIHSFSSTSSNPRHSEDNSRLSTDSDLENNEMMRKTYYEHTQDNDDNSIEDADFLHTSYKEDENDEHERLVSDDQDSQHEPHTVQSLKERRRTWICFLFLGILLIGWLAWIIIVNSLSPDGSTQILSSGNHIDLADISNSDFIPKRPSLVWLDSSEQMDGVFTFIDPENHSIMMVSVDENKKQVLLDSKDLMINHQPLSISRYTFSKDNAYMMLWTNETNVWRHSNLATIYIYNRSDKYLFPLLNTSTIDKPPNISYAVWSPVGHQVAYVMDNNLYISDLHSHKQITYDGSATVFNGVPDWVYEEEVLLQNFALWWSPDATHLAYLRLDETKVPELHLPIYTTDNDSYPDEMAIRYPKAGAPNPLASLFVYSLTQQTTIMLTKNATSPISVATKKEHQDFDEEDRIITEVRWITDSHTHLLFKQTNRIQDKQLTNLFMILDEKDSDDISSFVTTVDSYSPVDGGWIDLTKSVSFFGQYRNNDGSWAVDYVDIADNGSGYLHLAMMTIGQDLTIKKRWLTDGEWEVEQDSVVVDRKRALVHFISTERSPLERHLYTISLFASEPSITKKCLTCPSDADIHAYYRTTFSPSAGYYILYYEGPDIPTTVVKKVDDPIFELSLQKNDRLKKLLTKYDLPRKRMLTIKSSTTDMNAVELLPPSFDPKEKYPVLFQVYGGPSSQMVTYQFELDWHTFLTSKLQYIVVTVDGRGTGARGRGYRVGVRGRLGELETIDYTNAARHWAGLDYVDHARISIWGWSYGGFLASKCIEANSGVFSAGLAVAPVTDWRYYDSIYTERYMSTPKLNPQGYVNSAVNNMTGFANAKFLLVHGTADDNVHFQHTAILVDKLTKASIHTYKVQFYTDSNHFIEHNNANENLYYLLTDFLWESFGGEEYLHLRKETYGKFSGEIQGEGGGGHSHARRGFNIG